MQRYWLGSNLGIQDFFKPLKASVSGAGRPSAPVGKLPSPNAQYPNDLSNKLATLQRPKFSSQHWQAASGVRVQFGNTSFNVVPKDKVKSKDLTDLFREYGYARDTGTKNSLKDKIDALIQDPGIDFQYLDKYRTSLINELVKTGNSDWIKLAAENGVDFNKTQDLSYDKSPLLTLLKGNLPEDTLLQTLSTLKALGVNFNQNTEVLPLAYASQIGNSLKILEKLIEYGADVNGSATGGRPLLNAVIGNRVQKIDLLLAKGADVNVLTQRGETILHYMVRRGLDEVQKWVERGVAADVPDNEGVTPLMLAAEEAPFEVFRFLEKQGAAINRKDSLGYSFLGRVAANPDTRVFEHWMNTADLSQVTSKEVKFALVRCLETNNSERFKALLTRFPMTSAEINGKAVMDNIGPPMPLLMLACMNPGSEWAIEILLQTGANPNGSLSHGLFPRAGQMVSPIEFIVGNAPGEKFGRQTEEQIEQFLDAGLNPNLMTSTGIPLFFVVAAKGTAPLIQKMLAKGANPNIKDNLGNNLCLFAAKMGCPDVLQTWARRGVDPLAKNKSGLTARDIAEAAQEEIENIPIYGREEEAYVKEMMGNYQDTMLMLDHLNVPSTPGGKEKEIIRINSDRYGMPPGMSILSSFDFFLNGDMGW
jgi:uncharacterized protein